MPLRASGQASSDPVRKERGLLPVTTVGIRASMHTEHRGEIFLIGGVDGTVGPQCGQQNSGRLGFDRGLLEGVMQ